MYSHDYAVKFICDYPLEYATEGSAGVDLRSISELILLPRHRALVDVGLRVQLPRYYEMQIRSRSGMAINHGISVLNSPGTIDSDYRGPVKVILYNSSEVPFHVKVGDRIAQAVIAKYEQPVFLQVVSLGSTQRGEGGFGSTGK